MLVYLTPLFLGEIALLLSVLAIEFIIIIQVAFGLFSIDIVG